jgi:hypothetical protein
MQFNPADPFPLLSSLAQPSATYQEMLAHSAAADAWLGLQIEKIESELSVNGCRMSANLASGEKQQLWIGLAPTSLQTPYPEIRDLIERLDLKSGSVIADLGAAYGRMGFVIGKCYPELSFIGYEYVGERVQEFKRCASKFKFPNVKLIHVDLSSPNFQPQAADVYFIYDYGSPKAIRKTLYDLQRIAKQRPITVIGRGRASRDAIEQEHPWLSQVETPEHFPRYSLYRSCK